MTMVGSFVEVSGRAATKAIVLGLGTLLVLSSCGAAHHRLDRRAIRRTRRATTIPSTVHPASPTGATPTSVGPSIPTPTIPTTTASPSTSTTRVSPTVAGFAPGSRDELTVDNGSRIVVTEIYVPTGSPPYPTVVFAAGYDIEPDAYQTLFRQWQQAGFLVAAPSSPGMAPSAGPIDESELADVPSDLSSVTTAVISAHLADPARLDVVGHSDGGSAVAALALTSDHGDQRFRGYVVLAGDVVSIPDQYGPRNQAPLFAAVGSQDEYGNATLTPSVFDVAAAPKVLVVAQGGTHLGSFLGTDPQATLMDAAILDFLETTDLHGEWAPLLALNGQSGLQMTTSGQ
ncbi:MAG: alpha/beta hydrolase [Actinobacteria bacterium]|nr:alpha/beta hydrolase [Actinomycetota bacterium]